MMIVDLHKAHSRGKKNQEAMNEYVGWLITRMNEM